MPRYNIAVEIEIEADDPEKAWKLVAVPFHDGTMRRDQPLWLNPLVAEPELMEGGK